MILDEGKTLQIYTTATAMAEAFNNCIRVQRRAFADIKSADDSTRETFPHGHWGFLPTVHFRGRDFGFDDASIESLLWAYNLVAWAVIVEKIGLRKILSSANQRKLDEALDVYRPIPPDNPNALPWLTADAIQDVLAGWLNSVDDFLYELTREEYDYWKPHRQRGFKTDKFEKLAERVISTHMLSQLVTLRTDLPLPTTTKI